MNAGKPRNPKLKEKTMKSIIRTLTAGIAFALASGIAYAGGVGSSTLHDRLTQEEGLKFVSDGLYAESSDSGESFVATNAKGRVALAQKIRALQPQIQTLLNANGVTRAERLLLDSLDERVRTLQAPVAKGTQEHTGTCSNGAMLYARATATAGTSASGYAVVSLDFGPVTPTLNEASATTDTNGAYDTGSAYDAAQASVSESLSCFSDAAATVTCPGDSGPAVSAFAYSVSRAPRCRL
jgi:hypothetical protein